jgi:hypothetical protein
MKRVLLLRLGNMYFLMCCCEAIILTEGFRGYT